MRFDEFVNIEKVNTSFDPNDMISVCKRENNTKRDFVFVNEYQGKHVPADPDNILKLFKELLQTTIYDKRYNNDESICVIGFAETATAIGQYIAENISNKDKHFLKTTREVDTNKVPLVEFKEEHSHATEQFLYGDVEKLKSCDRILFVEDEISTGKTILNFIEKLNKIKDFKYSVASFLNLQSQEDKIKFNKNSIDVYALIYGTIKDKSKIVEVKNITCPLNNLPQNEKTGTLVIGAEEDMYYGILKAKKLKRKSTDMVYFQASTRSPITPSEDKEYSLYNRIDFPSAKDDNRKVYLYNVNNYDRVLIMANQSQVVYKNKSFIKKAYLDIFSKISNQVLIEPYRRGQK